MGFLSAEELNRLLPAETFAYPSPIPTQSVSSDEFMFDPKVRQRVGVDHPRSRQPLIPGLPLTLLLDRSR